MRIYDLAERLGFRSGKSDLNDTWERLWALLDRADYAERAYTELTLWRYKVFIQVNRRTESVVAKETRARKSRGKK